MWMMEEMWRRCGGDDGDGNEEMMDEMMEETMKEMQIVGGLWIEIEADYLHKQGIP